jgi:hypothetical protein
MAYFKKHHRGTTIVNGRINVNFFGHKYYAGFTKLISNFTFTRKSSAE